MYKKFKENYNKNYKKEPNIIGQIQEPTELLKLIKQKQGVRNPESKPSSRNRAEVYSAKEFN